MSDDIYITAARAHHRMSLKAPNYDESVKWLATQQQFRWAVDAARAPLLAEVERLKAHQQPDSDDR